MIKNDLHFKKNFFYYTCHIRIFNFPQRTKGADLKMKGGGASSQSSAQASQRFPPDLGKHTQHHGAPWTTKRLKTVQEHIESHI